MAVYTRFSHHEMVEFLLNYNIGTLIDLIEIEQGVENSNYFLITTEKKFIFTIYEKRVDIHDLPYFLDFSEHLKTQNINTPQPIKSNNQKTFLDFKNKKAAIITFLEGNNLDIPNQKQCASAGKLVAQMHIAQRGFKQKRSNPLSPQNSLWQLYDKISPYIEKSSPKMYNLIANEINYLKSFYPQEGLEVGNIHADIFPDNMFFNQNDAIGIIDFYFSCTDFLLYDLAIVLCAWCFEGGHFKSCYFKDLLHAYQTIRPLSQIEKQSILMCMRGAAMRFFLTRMHDDIFHDPQALVSPKDPNEYYQIIAFLQNNNVTFSNLINNSQALT